MNRKTFNHRLVDLQPLVEEYPEGKRHYRVPGGHQLYPSITTILSSVKSKGLEEWKERVGPEEAGIVSRVTANRGQNLHKIVENYLLNQERPEAGFMPDVVGMFRGMLKKLAKVDNILVIEGQVYSSIHRYAGRCDIIAGYNGVNSVIDIKTHQSDLFYTPEKISKYFIQTAGYAMAFEELTGITVNKGTLIFGSNDFGASVYEADLTIAKKKWIKIVEGFHSAKLKY